MSTPLRAADYARISVHDKNIPKVEEQHAAVRKLAASRNLGPPREFEDDGISASTGAHRPGFEDLLKAVRAGEVDVILATEEERFARTMEDKERLEAACIAAGVTWVTVRDGEVDPATADGAFMSDFRAAMGKRESRRKGERQRDANMHRREAGKPTPGQRAIGWKIVGGKKVDQPLGFESVPQEQALIRRGIELALAGTKPHSVARAFNRTGIKTARGNDWTSTSVISALTRARNAGWTEHKGELVAEGNWEAICTLDELRQVRTMFAERVRTPGWRQPIGLCSGIARCTCGESMVITGYASKRKYRCSMIAKPGKKAGKHVQIATEQLDALVRKAVIDSYFLTPPGTLAAQDPDASELAGLYERRTSALGKIAQIQDDRDAGVYTQAEAVKKISKHRQAAEQAEHQIAGHAARSGHAAMLVETRAALLRDDDHRVNINDAAKLKLTLGDRFDGMDLDQRRTLVSSLPRITVHPGRTDDRVEVEDLGAPVLDGEDAQFPD